MQPQKDPVPKPAKIEAAVSLLADPDRRIVEACRSRLIAWGTLARPALERAAHGAPARVRVRARAVIRTLDVRDWVGGVQGLVQGDLAQQPEGPCDHHVLERAAATIAALLRPDAPDAGGCARVLQRLAEDVMEQMRERSSGGGKARVLALTLAADHGFTGESGAAFDPDHVFLDTVLERRRGMASCMALLYVLVGRRAGLDVRGVELPDRYLVRVHGARAVLLDPFRDGVVVTKADCMRHLRHLGLAAHARVLLEDVEDWRLLDAMLHDLQRVYGYREDAEICLALQEGRKAFREVFVGESATRAPRVRGGGRSPTSREGRR